MTSESPEDVIPAPAWDEITQEMVKRAAKMLRPYLNDQYDTPTIAIAIAGFALEAALNGESS